LIKINSKVYSALHRSIVKFYAVIIHCIFILRGCWFLCWCGYWRFLL